MRCIAESVPSRPSFDAAPGGRPFALRGYRSTDVESVAAIVAEALHESYDPSLYGSLSAEWPAGFLVAVDSSDRPIGFLLGVNQVTNEGRVLMFAVERAWRNAGVGAHLMDVFLERCRVRRFRRVTLEVRVSNAPAIRFYARYRYSVIDLLRAYYSDGENGYHMALEL